MSTHLYKVAEIVDCESDFPPDCEEGNCKRCYKCYSIYVSDKIAGELDE